MAHKVMVPNNSFAKLNYPTTNKNTGLKLGHTKFIGKHIKITNNILGHDFLN